MFLAKIEHVVTPLRPEDVWMDIAVEPYVDDYSVIGMVVMKVIIYDRNDSNSCND